VIRRIVMDSPSLRDASARGLAWTGKDFSALRAFQKYGLAAAAVDPTGNGGLFSGFLIWSVAPTAR